MSKGIQTIVKLGIQLDKEGKIVYYFHNIFKCNDRENVAASISESRRLL